MRCDTGDVKGEEFLSSDRDVPSFREGEVIELAVLPDPLGASRGEISREPSSLWLTRLRSSNHSMSWTDCWLRGETFLIRGEIILIREEDDFRVRLVEPSDFRLIEVPLETGELAMSH